MNALVKDNGGLELWQTATDEHRAEVITKLFDKYPTVISKRAFSYEDESVHFEIIFSRLDKDTAPWQKMIRIKFVKLALETYEAMVENNDLRRLEAFWGKVSRCKEIADLKLGGVGNVPCRRRTEPARPLPESLKFHTQGSKK